MLKCAVVMLAGLVLVPSAAAASPVDTVPVDPVPAETVPANPVPVDTVPVEPVLLPEGCAQVDDVVVCVGPPPMPYESVGGPVDNPTVVASPEAVVAPLRAAAAPAVPLGAVATAEVPAIVASEAPVPSPVPAGPVTLGHRNARSVTVVAADRPSPVVPAPDEISTVPTMVTTLLFGAVVALAVAAGFRRARARS